MDEKDNVVGHDSKYNCEFLATMSHRLFLQFPACIGMDSRLFCSLLLALAWNPADLMFGKCFLEMP